MRGFTTLGLVAVLAFAVIARANEPMTGQVVSLEVLIAEVGSGAIGENEVTAEMVLELEKQGKLAAVARLQLSVLENTPGVINFSESVPVPTGRQSFGGRGGGLTYSMQDHGTMLQVTARVEEGAIVVELQAERSRLVMGSPASGEEDTASIPLTRTAKAHVRSTTKLASGKPTILGSQQSGVGIEAIHTYFVITAKVAEGAKRQ